MQSAGSLGQQAPREVPANPAEPPEPPRDAALWVHPLQPSDPGSLCHSWVLYEEPEFRGQKLVLPEGDVELRAAGPAWSTHSIGSLRRVVRVSGLGLGARCCPGPWAVRRELESQGQRSQLVLGRGQRGFIMDSPIDSRPWSQLGSASLAWGGRGRQRPSPSAGKQPEEV